MREVKSFTISKDILKALSLSKGSSSTSERVNELLRRALDQERREQLESEAADFFGKRHGNSNQERAAFQKAARQSLERD